MLETTRRRILKYLVSQQFLLLCYNVLDRMLLHIRLFLNHLTTSVFIIRDAWLVRLHSCDQVVDLLLVQTGACGGFQTGFDPLS